MIKDDQFDLEEYRIKGKGYNELYRHPLLKILLETSGKKKEVGREQRENQKFNSSRISEFLKIIIHFNDFNIL